VGVEVLLGVEGEKEVVVEDWIRVLLTLNKRKNRKIEKNPRRRSALLSSSLLVPDRRNSDGGIPSPFLLRILELRSNVEGHGPLRPDMFFLP